jgi:hypothetical protein
MLRQKKEAFRKEILDELKTEKFPVKIRIGADMEPFLKSLMRELQASNNWIVKIETVANYNCRNPDLDPRFLIINPSQDEEE